MLGMRRHNGAHLGKHLSACREDIAALQKDAVLLADDIAALATEGTSQLKEQADLVSRTVRATLPQRSKRGQLTIFRRVAVALFSIGSVAMIGALLTRR